MPSTKNTKAPLNFVKPLPNIPSYKQGLQFDVQTAIKPEKIKQNEIFDMMTKPQVSYAKPQQKKNADPPKQKNKKTTLKTKSTKQS